MAVLKDSRSLRDAPGGAVILQVPGGTRVTVGATLGAWIEVTLVDHPDQPKGWVSAAAVDLAADTLGPLDKQVFALESHWHAAIFGVSAHYLAAIAALRSNMIDGVGDDGTTGPYRFTAAEWTANATQPQFQLAAPAAAIGSWSLQVAVFAIMARLMQVRVASLLGSQPTATEQYFAQMVGSRALVAGLQDRAQPVADLVAAIDGAAALAEGIDVANLTGRDARLLGTGSVGDALTSISAALTAAFAETREAMLKAGDQLIADGSTVLAPAGPAGGRIDFDSPEIPAGRRDMAELIAMRFADAGYGVIQQVAAIANAIGESGLDPTIKAAGNEPSYGLFQLNQAGGVGTGHSVAVLTDPEQNIAIMLAYMASLSADKAFRNTVSLHDAVAIFVRDFERPANSAGAIARRSGIAQALLA
ncbi:MAG: hypothetical protein IPK28_20670 [Devosia sp.]|nr:hypothetical protein [Devosia sp.]